MTSQDQINFSYGTWLSGKAIFTPERETGASVYLFFNSLKMKCLWPFFPCDKIRRNFVPIENSQKMIFVCENVEIL